MSDEHYMKWGAEAERAFQHAYLRAKIENLLRKLARQPQHLLSFNEVKVRLGIHPLHELGMREIPLNRIVGSVGKPDAFTPSFLPRYARLKERWKRVYAGALSSGGLPSIEVYQVGDVYFIKDGHHRVSVACRLGATTMMADVTRFVTTTACPNVLPSSRLNVLAAMVIFILYAHTEHKKGALMSPIDNLVHDFLAQKRIAVVGVSDKRETGCNLGYRKFKEAGYTVYAVNPHLTTFQGAPCYPDLLSIPDKPNGVFILANPKVTEQIVQQCVDLGIKHVWMHCMMGTKPGLAAGMTSVSPAAVQLCRENGIAVIPGSCPNQFLKPDFGHALMRVIWRMLGFLKVSQNGSLRAET